MEMKALIVTILGLVVAEARLLRHVIEVQPDTCTVFGFEMDVYESFRLFVDVSNYPCTSTDNLMFMSRPFHAGECIVEAKEDGCLAGPLEYPSESICDYWEDVHHLPFDGNLNSTAMLVGGGQTCTTKRHYSFAFRSDCDVSGPVELNVETSVLSRENKQLCVVRKSSTPLIMILVILGCLLLLCIAGVVVVCVFCPCCPGSKTKHAAPIEPLSSFKDLLLASRDNFDDV